VKKTLKIALAGNPNSGKTTIFNRITGAHQHVGNYPGVTVDIKEGRRDIGGIPAKIIDLPGTYSLTAHSEEELVTRNYLLDKKPDVVIDIIDTSTLERQLYLAVQLIELEVPLVLGFNMSDMAERAGMKFDLELMSRLLGAPVVRTVGTNGEGVDELLKKAREVADGSISYDKPRFSYGRDLDAEIDTLICEIEKSCGSPFDGVPTRWVAIKLLEQDDQVLDKFGQMGGLPEAVSTALENAGKRLGALFQDPPDMLIAEARYGIISGAASEAVTRTIEQRHDISDTIDTVLISPVFGLPIFLLMMYMVFYLTFTLGEPLMGLLENLIGWLGILISGWWPEGSQSALRSLIVDGVINGVGGVVVFLPNILILFLAIAFLEDTGYMARAAFIMDRMMHKIGLHGKSFIPMLIGFGCSVPAIMGTRILENKRDRLVTILVIPLMSCGARLPIYALIIPAFFPRHLQGPMLWSIYLIGIILAVVITKLLRSTLYKGESTPFVMELPPYRMPTLQALLIHAWERGYLYIRKAGTVILAISIVLWTATSYPKPVNYSQNFDLVLNEARAAYDAGVLELNDTVGLAENDTSLLTRLEQFQDRDLYSGGSSGKLKIDEFAILVAEIQDLGTDFNESVDEHNLSEGSPDYLLVENDYEDSLAELRDQNQNLFPAAWNYSSGILPGYREVTKEVELKIREENLEYSVIGRIAKGVEPLLTPIGFDWKIGTAFLGAFAAKEVFVAQMGIIYSIGDVEQNSESLRETLREKYSPLIGFCIMLFALITAPCIATIAVTRAETKSWKVAMTQLVGLTVLAWILTLIVYQAGSAMGIGV